MKLLVSGATGLVGSALLPFLAESGHSAARLVRRPPEPGSDDVFWDPAGGVLDGSALELFDACVHLSGENIAEGKWDAEKKRRIRDSRVASTELLSGRLAALPARPRTLVCASAIGYYGNRGDEVLTEASRSGNDFLASVCRDWEAATAPARV